MANERMTQSLERHLQGKVLIMGIGNTLRGDDAAGPRLVEMLQAKSGEKFLYVDAGPAPERHFGEIEAAAPEAVLLVDAVDWGGAPGEVAFFDEASLPARACTTHDVSLRLVMQYLRLQTGTKVGLIGIQPAQADLGAGMTDKVQETLVWLSDCLARIKAQEVKLAGVGA